MALVEDEQRNLLLEHLADAIISAEALLIEANKKDLAQMDANDPLYDRLLLTPERLQGIASDMRHVASLPSPLGIITKERTLDNGLYIIENIPFFISPPYQVFRITCSRLLTLKATQVSLFRPSSL